MHLKTIFARVSVSAIFVLVALCAIILVPTSFVLRGYPDESVFDEITRIYFMNSPAGDFNMTHESTQDASSILPKTLLPQLIVARKKAFGGPVQISVSAPRCQLKVFSAGTPPNDVKMYWYVINEKVVEAYVVKNGIWTSLDVIDFVKIGRKWISFLKASVAPTQTQGKFLEPVE